MAAPVRLSGAQGITGTFYALDFGVKCDGQTPDNEPITALLDYVAQLVGQGQVSLPPGATCVINGPITGRSNVTLIIPETTTLQATPSFTGSAMFLASSAPGVSITGGGLVDGNGVAAVGISLSNCTDPVLNVEVTGCKGRGITLITCTRPAGNIITHDNGRDGLYLTDTNAGRLSVTAYDNGTVLTSDGILIDGTSTGNTFGAIVATDTHANGSKTQNYGIAEASGMTGDYNTWSAAYLQGNATGPSSTVGANSGQALSAVFNSPTINTPTISSPVLGSAALPAGTTPAAGEMLFSESGFWGALSEDASGETIITANIVKSPTPETYKYIADGAAMLMLVSPTNGFQIYKAASGVAGAAASLVPVMSTPIAAAASFANGLQDSAGNAGLNFVPIDPTAASDQTILSGSADVTSSTAFTVTGLPSNAVAASFFATFTCATVGAYFDLYTGTGSTLPSAGGTITNGTADAVSGQGPVKVTTGATNQLAYQIHGTSSVVWSLRINLTGYWVPL